MPSLLVTNTAGAAPFEVRHRGRRCRRASPCRRRRGSSRGAPGAARVGLGALTGVSGRSRSRTPCMPTASKPKRHG